MGEQTKLETASFTFCKNSQACGEVKFNHGLAISLNLGSPELIDQALVNSATKLGYVPKENLAITFVGFSDRRLMINRLNDGSLMHKPKFSTLIEQVLMTDWQWEATGELYLMETDDQGGEPAASIIELVDCPGLDEVYDELKNIFPELISRESETPPPYVTLFVKEGLPEVQLASCEDLKMLGAPFVPITPNLELTANSRKVRPVQFFTAPNFV